MRPEVSRFNIWRRLTRCPDAPNPSERVLVILGSVSLYGMERAVIELFASVRPEIQSTLLIPLSTAVAGTDFYRAITSQSLDVRYFLDKRPWSRLAIPRSTTHARQMIRGLVQGNVDALRASCGAGSMYVPATNHLNFALLACALMRLRGRRVIFAVHDTDLQRHYIPVIRWLVTDLVFHSSFVAHTWWERYPQLRATRRATIPLIIDVSPAPPTQHTSGNQILLFLGQISLHKGVDLLLQAFVTVAKKHPSAMLRLAGEFASPEFEAWCRDFVCAHHLQSRISFLGYVSDRVALLSSAYVLILPTRTSICSESFGRVPVEAAAFGVPSIVSTSGALPEFVQAANAGIVCEPETSDGLASCLDYLLGHTDVRNDLARNAAMYFSSVLSPAVVTQRWRQFFRSDSPTTISSSTPQTP